MRLDTARWTGLFYLGVAITGALAFIVLRPQLFVAGDPAGTLAKLTDNAGGARWIVTFELGVVVTQALAAVWFYRLFRSVDGFAAGLIAAFGLMNAVLVLVSAGLLATAAGVAVTPYGSAADAVQTLYLVSGSLWAVGGVPFGLWLVPMGWLVLRSRWMPRPLGWVLVVGGVCYVIGAFLGPLLPDARALVDALAYPATLGEFWMIGHLLIRGVRRHEPTPAPLPAVA